MCPMISFIEIVLNKLQNFLAHFARNKVTIEIFHEVQLVFVYNLAFSSNQTNWAYDRFAKRTLRFEISRHIKYKI